MTNQEKTKKKEFSEIVEQLNEISNKNVTKNINKPSNKLEEENNVLNSKLKIMEEENFMLKEMFNKANTELNNIRKPALLVADVVNTFEKNKAVIKLLNGNKFYCYFSQEIKDLSPGDTVLVDQKSLNIVEKVEVADNFDVEKFVIIEKPQENWGDIGGLRSEIEEVKEVIELPLKKPHLFKKVGIKPPKGTLLYGPPGTGKTLLAKAVAHSTDATFIEIVGSELVQKFIGEGAKLVKEIFNLARKKAPAIVFIDELDALAARRMETGTSGEREVSRTFMQLLAELDGFKHLDNVKIIGATNRIDILDTAITRPGRLDRLIHIGLPNSEGILEILKVHTQDMNLEKVKLKTLVKEMENFSGAEIRAVCTEAGYFAIRENRSSIHQNDFLEAIEKVKTEEEDEDHKDIFG